MSNILLLNAGSSSLKATLVRANDGQILASAHADWASENVDYSFVGLDGVNHTEQVKWRGQSDAVRRVIQDLQQVEPVALPSLNCLQAVGHRIVHGGRFTTAVQITPDVRSTIESQVDLAPLHNPPSLIALTTAERAFPDVPHVAVFDTSFHSTIPAEASTYAVPRSWTENWCIRRYGFHGLSHAYCSERAAVLLNRPLTELRLVICHLGHGCSAAAVDHGRCVDTTMGFTPLEGLMMATRSGSIDPAIVTYVQQHRGLTAEAVEKTLNRESGLLGVSGISADMREILSGIRDGHESAKLAFAMYTRRIRQSIGAFAVTMNGLDALVFTAGVGEHSHEVRAEVCRGLECLGVEMDSDANLNCQADAEIATPASKSRILVIKTHEDVTMLKEVRRVIGTLS